MTLKKVVNGKEIDLTHEEILERQAADANAKEREVEYLSLQARIDRDKRLAECDWTQLPNSPVDAAAWETYRQALRDVPAQEGFPNDVIWPTKPA